MEYFLGSVLTLASVYLMNRLVARSRVASRRVKGIRFSQSYVYDLTKDMYSAQDMMPSFVPRVPTQATKHFDRRSTRVLYMDGLAWFIQKIDGINALHVAEMTEDGVDTESIKRVDTMGMDDVELKKTMFIVEKLTEGL